MILPLSPHPRPTHFIPSGLIREPQCSRGLASLDVLASLDSIVTGAVNSVYNAATGQLTSSQLQAIKDQTNAQIDQASGGNAALAAQAKAQASSEIDAAAASVPGGITIPSLSNVLGVSTSAGSTITEFALLGGAAILIALLVFKR